MVEIENCWTQIMEVRKNVISGYSVIWMYTISLLNKQGIYGDEHVQCLYEGQRNLNCYWRNWILILKKNLIKSRNKIYWTQSSCTDHSSGIDSTLRYNAELVYTEP